MPESERDIVELSEFKVVSRRLGYSAMQKSVPVKLASLLPHTTIGYCFDSHPRIDSVLQKSGFCKGLSEKATRMRRLFHSSVSIGGLISGTALKRALFLVLLVEMARGSQSQSKISSFSIGLVNQRPFEG